MSKRPITYIVTVEVRTIELYEVDAESSEKAMELWQDGELLKQEFSRLEAEPVSAEEKGKQRTRSVAEFDRSRPFDIHEFLARRRQVAVIWCVEDVQGVRPHLTDDQAWEVLQQCRRVHDCEVGFNWLLIETVADDLFPREDDGDSAVTSNANDDERGGDA
jgi:hypothetical protein